MQDKGRRYEALGPRLLCIFVNLAAQSVRMKERVMTRETRSKRGPADERVGSNVRSNDAQRSSEKEALVHVRDNSHSK